MLLGLLLHSQECAHDSRKENVWWGQAGRHTDVCLDFFCPPRGCVFTTPDVCLALARNTTKATERSGVGVKAKLDASKNYWAQDTVLKHHITQCTQLTYIHPKYPICTWHGPF